MTTLMEKISFQLIVPAALVVGLTVGLVACHTLHRKNHYEKK